MTTATATLADFLLARISEDEAVARAANPSPWHRVSSSVHNEDHGIASTTAYGFSERNSFDAEHIARHDPARVLADCAARRAIVELHAAYPTPQQMAYGTITACSECGSVDDSPVEWPCLTLRHLAAPYASHPDFDPAWVA